ncbi:DUF1810 domain-containing protein [Novosphingobium flavum]|uniref:DUF1810 domain-containing protein n=1 Tax=Novosphingobium flavum TaxID=1778672 RepID=A0A7X1KMY9_9SPHN|nr:DUF1810 domain-containing protein [Novosphingobium flavum]MBC2667107.1 DUF1810 domain-containing protein [Novosphingobium flavum]
MTDSLDRFVGAQAETYAAALAELKAGVKRSHWMWFVFPQLRGLGRSHTAWHYGLVDAEEARAYLAHPVLGARLAVSTEAMLDWAGQRSAETILGPVDALKLRSCLTLFEAAGGEAHFAEALEAFYGGERDPATLALLG